MRRAFVIVVLLAATLPLTPGQAGAHEVTVTVAGGSACTLTPATVGVHPGQVVVFRTTEASGGPWHNLTSDSANWAFTARLKPMPAQDQEASFAFDTPGTYRYRCDGTTVGEIVVALKEVRALATDEFAPAVLEATLLDTVKFVNTEAATGDRHTVTSTTSNWNVHQDLAPGKSFTVQFPSEGTYGYRCLRHAGMAGQVVVTKGLDPGITLSVTSPFPDDNGRVNVTGVFNLSGAAAHPTDAVWRVQVRSIVPGTATTITATAAPAFSPAIVTGNRIDAVAWTNGDTGLTHDIVVDGTGVRLALPPKTTVRHTFLDEGRYTYRCLVHPAMKGALTVDDVSDARWAETATATAWTDAKLEDGRWRWETTTNDITHGSRRLVQVRAETAQAYQAEPTEVLLQAAHHHFTAEVVGLADGATVSGDFPLQFRVEHPLWGPKKVEAKIWNTKRSAVTVTEAEMHWTVAGTSIGESVLETDGQSLLRVGNQPLYQPNTLKTASHGQMYFPGGVWRTDNLPDGDYWINLTVTYPDYATKAFAPNGNTKDVFSFRFVVDNYADVRSAGGASPNVDLGTVAGSLAVTGTAPSGTTRVEWAYSPIPGGHCPTPSDPDKPDAAAWRAATLTGGGGWTFVLPTADTSWRIADGGYCVQVRAFPGDRTDVTRLTYWVDVDNADHNDVRIVALTQPSVIGVQAQSVTVTIENFGNVPVTGEVARNVTRNATLEYWYEGAWHKAERSTLGLSTLPAYGTANFDLNWDAPGTPIVGNVRRPDVLFTGTFPIRLTVDSVQVLAETDETNNVATGQMTWMSASLPTGRHDV